MPTDPTPLPGPAVALVGTTASGKSALALRVARDLPDVELVSIDSMQVYRGMDIGTASPTAAERAAVRHHLVDVADPWEEWSLARFQVAARHALDDIAARGRRALLVGGTGLYLRALIDGLDIPGQHPEARAAIEAEPDTRALHRRLEELDPVAAARMEPDNRRRILRALEVTIGSGRPFSSYGPGLEAHPATVPQVGIRLPPEITAARIEARYHAQIEAGFVAEVDALLALPHPLGRTAAQALGYRELIAHRQGELSLDDALDQAIRRTRRFARRQRSWFRRDPRITWFDAVADPEEVADALVAHVARALDAPVVQVVEQAWGREPGASLIAALMADLDVRYDRVARPDDPPPEDIAVPGARPAPAAAPSDSPAWDIDPDDVARPRGAFLVAHRNGGAVACGALRPLPGGDPSIAEVKRMYTAPAARGRGVARALLRRLVAVAGELGYRQVVLETGTRQPEAIALYRSEGWVPLAPYGQYCGEHLSRCFLLDLPNPPAQS